MPTQPDCFECPDDHQGKSVRPHNQVPHVYDVFVKSLPRTTQATLQDLPRHRFYHMLCVQVPKLALQTVFRGEPLQNLAQKVAKLAADGLRRRGRGEEQFLEPLQQIADSGVTVAERMLALYHGAWGGSLDPLYDGSFDY